MTYLRRILLNQWTLSLFTIAVCLWGIGGGPRLGDHECINAQSARQMLQTGDWLVPSVGEAPRIRKPPLGAWLIAASAWLMHPTSGQPPVSEFSARLPQALAAMLNVLVIAWLAKRMFGARIGRIAGFVAAASMTTLYFSHSALVEMALTLFVTLSFACLWRALEGVLDTPSPLRGSIAMRSASFARSGESGMVDRRWLAAGYAAFAVAMMAKMPLPLAIVAPAVSAYWILVLPALSLTERTAPSVGGGWAEFRAGVWAQLRRMGQLWSTPGLLVVLLVCGGWTFWVARHAQGAWDLWRQEYLDRFTGDMAERSHAFWYYAPILLGWAAPFSFFVPEAIATPVLRRYRRYRRASAFLLCWGGCGFLVLSAAAFKRAHYLAAVMPPLLILLALVTDRVFMTRRDTRKRATKALCTAIPLMLIVATAVLAAVLADRYTGIGRLAYGGMALLMLLWAVAAVAYGQGWRAASLAALVLASPVMLAVGWRLAAYDEEHDLKIPGLAAALTELQSGPENRIIQIDSRVDARLLFYEHLPVERLFTPVEMAQLRPARRYRTPAMVVAANDRIQALIDEDPHTLFIMDADRFEDVRAASDLRLVELARVKISRDDPSKADVILGRRDMAAPAGQRPGPLEQSMGGGDSPDEMVHHRSVSCGHAAGWLIGERT